MNKKIANKRLTKRKINRYDAGSLLEKMNSSSSQAASKAFSGSNLGGSLGTIGGAIGTIVQAGLDNAKIKDTSAEHAAIDETANTTFSSGSYDNLQEAWNPSLIQRANYTQRQVRGQSGWKMAGNTAKGVFSGAMAGAQIGGPWGAVAGAAVGLGGGLAGVFVGNAKARREAASLNAEATLANKEMLNNYAFAADNTYNMNFNKGLLNFAAYGGDLNMSGDFNNGLIFINAGGTHEQNPFEGVQLGVDNEGTPNMVEEGEIVYNDYVFSNRLKPTEAMLEEVGLNKKYKDWTFAKIIEDLQLESSQNPTDWIVENTLEDNINRVMILQEKVRAKKNKTQNKNMFPWGGDLDMQIAMQQANTYNSFLNDYNNGQFNANKVEAPIIPHRDTSIEMGLPVIENPFNNTASTAINNNPDLNIVNYAIQRGNENRATNKSNSNFNWQSLGRLAPIVTNAGTLISNMKKPDYSQADRIEQAARNIPGGSFTPLGDFINLESVDRNYLLNPMINTSRSTARDIQNQGLNAGQAMAGLLANNYNTQRNIGSALIQAEQENMNRALQEAQFNRGTNQANAQMGLQALAMDQQKAQNVLAATEAASRLRQTIDAQRSTALGKAIENTSEDASLLAQEATQKEWLQMLIDSGALHSPKTTAKNGGKLLTKKRKK